MLLVQLFHYWAWTGLVSAQVVSPSVPPAVVSDRAAQIVLDNPTACNHACATLASLFPSQVDLGTAGQFHFFDFKQSSITPACRIEPDSAQDVSTILTMVINEGCQFAVKSGGHARDRGASNTEDGVTIDLVRMSGVRIVKDRKSAVIGAGARWGDIYPVLEAEKLMVIGGRVSSVGIGGLTLGGGLSFYSAEHGLACDNVISYEIVLPDGSITQVSESSQPDLFFSLRGAGSMLFGIVVSFTLETFQPRNPAGLWHTERWYSWDTTPQVLEKAHDLYTGGMAEDHHVGGWTFVAYAQRYDMFLSGYFYTHTEHDDASTYPSVFQSFADLEGLPDTTTTQVDTFTNITTAQHAKQPIGLKNIYSTFSFHPNLEFQVKVSELWKGIIEGVKDSVEPFIAATVFHPFTQRMVHLGNTKRGGNALGIKDEDGPLVMLQPVFVWGRDEDDAVVYAVYDELMEKAEHLAKEMGIWHRYKYVNYGHGSQDVYAGYGKESLERLIKVQKEMDPKGVFAKGGLGGGYFKLPVARERAEEQRKRDEL